MTSNQFESKNAIYHQIYALHTKKLNDPIFTKENFSSVDAVVYEAYHGKRWFDFFWKDQLKTNDNQMFAAVQESAKPLYVVDIKTNGTGIAIERLGNMVLDLVGAALIYTAADKIIKQRKDPKQMTRREAIGFWATQTLKTLGGGFLVSDFLCGSLVTSTGESPEYIARLVSARMHAFPTPQYELRNAISARKIEEFIVPELTQRLGRKPKIVLMYGAGHAGLKEDIQYPAVRNSVLGLYGSIGFAGIDITYLDTITNVTIDKDGNYSLAERKAGLFK